MLTHAEDTDTLTSRSKRRYRFLGKLGCGGMAEVYLGIQRWVTDFNSLVAIKRLHRNAVTAKLDDPLQLFVDEARVIASLSHPHIVKVNDLLIQNDDILIVMEYVNGETFQTLMTEMARQQSRIPLPIICRWIMDAAEALHYAHNAVSINGEPLRLIHRDIDMRNLMVDENGYLKIIDFGVAQTIMKHRSLDGEQPVMGKVSYSAPEVFCTPSEVDHRVDLYALGLVFHALVTGRKPYPAKNAASTTARVQQVIHEPLLAPSTLNHELPKQLDLLIAQATHKEPQYRFQSGEAFSDAVAHFAKTHCGLATPQEMKRWYQTHFSSRIEDRTTFVQQAVSKAKAFIESDGFYDDEPGRDSITPSLILNAVTPEATELHPFEDTEAYDEKATAVMAYPTLKPTSPFRANATGLIIALTILGATVSATVFIPRSTATGAQEISQVIPSSPPKKPHATITKEPLTELHNELPSSQLTSLPATQKAQTMPVLSQEIQQSKKPLSSKIRHSSRSNSHTIHRKSRRPKQKNQENSSNTRVRLFTEYRSANSKGETPTQVSAELPPAPKKFKLIESYN